MKYKIRLVKLDFSFNEKFLEDIIKVEEKNNFEPISISWDIGHCGLAILFKKVDD